MELQELTIDKLVFGGQGLGTLGDGRKAFIWNALPGETVRARIIKKRKSYVEGIAEQVLVPSKHRIQPMETNYLATSPWQILDYTAENEYKKSITAELFDREKVAIPAFQLRALAAEWHYRNKMEYSFWGDEDGLHLALHLRGSHGKQIVQGSKLALPAIDLAANTICVQLNKLGVRAGDLKTIIVRANQRGEAVVSLFTKLEQFPALELPPELKGLRVYHSNPKSPASVPTRLLSEQGDPLLRDNLLGKPFVYDVDSFFQVNLPIFEQALTAIRDHVSVQAEKAVTDMYAGVGSIGLSLGADKVTLVELDPATVRMASHNASLVSGQIIVDVVETSAEKSLQYITPGCPVVFDPPRAGLHPDVVKAVLAALPPQVVYLSCNPSTQARDLGFLQQNYEITFFEAYNFFPKTPHIEALAVLDLRR